MTLISTSPKFNRRDERFTVNQSRNFGHGYGENPPVRRANLSNRDVCGGSLHNSLLHTMLLPTVFRINFDTMGSFVLAGRAGPER